MKMHRLTSIDPAAQGGFTIVETFMVMVILAMLGMIALPRYSSFATTQKLEGAVRRVSADLLLAQRQARRSSASQTVTFNVVQNRYQLVGMNHPDHPSQPFDVYLGDEPYRARIVSASFGSDTQIIYDGFGKPDSGGQVVVAVGAYQKTVQVDVGTGKPLKTLDPIVIIEEYPPPEGGAEIQ